MNSHNTKITHRDLEVFNSLKLLPLTTTQLFRLSQSFAFPFPSERVVYRRMQRLAKGGMARRFYYAFPSNGRNPVYWRLTNKSLRMVGDSMQPRMHRRAVTSIGVSLHFHTHRLSEFLVCLLLSAQKASVQLRDLRVEQTISLGAEGDSIVPDATLTFAAQNECDFKFYVELDTGTERVATMQRIPSSIQKKLEFYERLRIQSNERFRVLFVTTSSKRRATNILTFSDQLSSNPTSRLVYAAFLPELLRQDNCVADPVFQDHKLRPVRLVRRARLCSLKIDEKENIGIYASLNQKEDPHLGLSVTDQPASTPW